MRDMFEGDEDLLRRYLLGEMSEEEEDGLEERLFLDDQLFQQAEVVEGDLLAQYARGELTPEQRSEVVRRWSASKGGRARLDLARALHQIGTPQEAQPPMIPAQPAAPAPPVLRFPFRPLQPSTPAWYRSVASLAAVLVLFVGAPLAIWLAGNNGDEAHEIAHDFRQAPSPVPQASPAAPAATPTVAPTPTAPPAPAVTPAPGPGIPSEAEPAPPARAPQAALVEVVSLAFIAHARGPEEAEMIVRSVREAARKIDFQVGVDAEDGEDTLYAVTLRDLERDQDVFQGEGLKLQPLDSGKTGLRFSVPADRVPTGTYELEAESQVASIPLIQEFEIRRQPN